MAANVTVPFPLAPPLIVSQASLLNAVHAHPAVAVTPVVEDPAPDPSEADVGDTPKVQDTPF